MIRNKKLLIIATIIVTVFLIILSIFVIKNEITYSKYLKVEATILNTRTRRSSSGRSNARTHYASYQYNVDGKNYITEKQVFTKTGKKIGKTEMLRYNPIDPSIIEDTAKQNQAKGMCVFFIIWNSMSYYMLLKELKSKIKEKRYTKDVKKMEKDLRKFFDNT